MKYFDRFAGIVERHLKSFIPRVQKTKLFVFPGRAHEILPKDISGEEMAKIRAEFFLPFQHVAIEDTLSLIFMWDEEKDQRGLQAPRQYLEYMELGVPLAEADAEASRSVHEHVGGRWPTDEEFERDRSNFHPHTALIIYGRFTNVDMADDMIGSDGSGGSPNFQLGMAKVYDPITNQILPITSFMRSRTDVDATIYSSMRNAWVAMKELWYFNSPEKFILEEKPADAEKHAAKAQKRGRIVRRHQRPSYTILHPQKIRERLRLPPVTQGGPKRPHERRAHRRTFKSDKFWRMQGKTIIIPATWVGPSKAVIGKKIYRVLLDK